MTDARFNACLPFTLGQEAPDPTNWSDPKNFSNDPHDPGGATYMGITQTEYNAWRKAQGLPIQDVRKITQTEGYAIYYNNYWLPHSPELSPGLDLCYFDSCVNQGNSQATKILQTVLGIASDGIWGPQTEATVEAISNVVATINAFTARREIVYEETRNFQFFGTDWMRRAQEIGTAAARAGVIKGHALALHAKFMLSGKEG